MQTLKDIFVSKEIAQKLKGIGFEEKCIAKYQFIETNSIQMFYRLELLTFPRKSNLPAPTYEQVYSWFREKGYHIIIDKVSDRYGYFIRQEERIDGEIKTDIYEQAREQAILKTIEIYKKEQ